MFPFQQYKEKDYYENCSQIIIQQNQDVRKPFQRALEEIMRDTKKTDWKNNREQLIQNMLLAEEGYGETKTRYFIQQIIFEAIKELKIYRLEEEQQNKTFSQKKIIPDMVICKRDQEINSNGQNHQKAGKIECGKKTLFVIEIKKPLSKNAIMGIDEGIEKLNRLELAKVIQIIQWLENIELLQQ